MWWEAHGYAEIVGKEAEQKSLDHPYLLTFPFVNFIAYRIQGRRMRMEMGIKRNKWFIFKKTLERGNDNKVSL